MDMYIVSSSESVECCFGWLIYSMFPLSVLPSADAPRFYKMYSSFICLYAVAYFHCTFTYIPGSVARAWLIGSVTEPTRHP